MKTFRRVILPLSLNGVKSGVQAVFIPSLSLFMLTRLIGGNRVITLGTAIERAFPCDTKLGHGFDDRCDFDYCYVLSDVLTGEKKRRTTKMKNSAGQIFILSLSLSIVRPNFYLIFIPSMMAVQ